MTSGNVLVIMGSVRAGRLCSEITEWVCEVGQAEIGIPLEIVDLRHWNLPMDDEPAQPILGRYEQAHTITWSEKVKAAAGFVFVTPQYNGGYPAALKNALDHLYTEWSDKPALIVSYGGGGGSQCAEQLRSVLMRFKMDLVSCMPPLRLTHKAIESQEIDAREELLPQQSAVANGFRDLATKFAN